MDENLAFYVIIIAVFWQSIGFQTIYFSTYLRAIDKTIYEAAKIDGASRFQVLRKITLPHMKPAIIFMVVTTAITSLMIFELIMTLFPFGAHETNRTIIYIIYQIGFNWRLDLGLASAIGWVAFFIILAVSLLQLRILGLGERHDD